MFAEITGSQLIDADTCAPNPDWGLDSATLQGMGYFVPMTGLCEEQGRSPPGLPLLHEPQGASMLQAWGYSGGLL